MSVAKQETASGVRLWIPVFCRGSRKSGEPCLQIIGYRHTQYVPGTFATLCRRCKLENVVT